MKKSKIVLFGLLFLILGACTKYEEGSNFSLLTAKARLVNHWDLINYQIDGVNQTIGANNGLQMDFYKDETFKRTWVVAGFQVPEEGSWTLTNKKETLILTKADGNMEAYKIIRLAIKDLKAERVDADGKTHLYTFKGK